MAVAGFFSCGMPLTLALLVACGSDDEGKQTLLGRFEAVYGYTDCKEVEIGTTLTQSTWKIVFQTYSGGYLDQKEGTYLDENCKTSLHTLNRFATYEILGSSNESSGEIHLKITTKRFMSVPNEKVNPE